MSIRRQRNGKDTTQTIPNSSDPVVTDKIPLKSLMVISDKTAKDIKIDNLPFNVKINFGPEAATVNEVTDQIQDYAEPSVPVIIHTGTKNVYRESAKTTQQRLQRLETNLTAKKLTTVAFSSVSYRGNEHMRNKITQVNSEMLRICNRNKWLFIDNDNVDETCLVTGSLKLNDEGVNILSLNFKNAILNFTAQQMNFDNIVGVNSAYSIMHDISDRESAICSEIPLVSNNSFIWSCLSNTSITRALFSIIMSVFSANTVTYVVVK